MLLKGPIWWEPEPGWPRIERFSETWGRHFPSVPEEELDTYAYPMPTTPKFWKLYGEPVEDFVAAGLALETSIRMLCSLRGKTRLTQRQQEVREQALDVLNGLAGTTSPYAVSDQNGAYRQDLQLTSLIGALAMMALQDLTGGGQDIHICAAKDCGRVFTSKAYQAAYCTERCKKRAEMQRYRDKDRKQAKSGRRGRARARS